MMEKIFLKSNISWHVTMVENSNKVLLEYNHTHKMIQGLFACHLHISLGCLQATKAKLNGCARD